MALQPRDVDILWSVFKHRYLSCEHIHQLYFPGKSMKVAQSRLRLLWENKFFDRYYRPWIYDGTRRSQWQASTPFYTLAENGAQVIWEDTALDWDEIPKTPVQNAIGWSYLKHHLVATDLMVAIEAGCQHRDDIEFVSFVRETAMRKVERKVSDRKQFNGPLAISDGAFTLRFPGTGQEQTFHIEVVRAGVKDGNKTLFQRMKRHAELHHQGYFDKVFGHKKVRAILFATTTTQRAEGFAKLASKLPHGRGLFWFTSFQQLNEDKLPITTFYPHTVFEPVWLGADGQTHSLIPPEIMNPTSASG